MENKKNVISAANNSRIRFEVINGHFATNHSHVSSYIDLSGIKNSLNGAKETAKELAGAFNYTPVQAIICVEGTRMVGAFLADELSSGMHGINAGIDISVITPEFGMNNEIILRDNIQQMIRGKAVLLLVSSVSSGKSVAQTMDCLNYYGGTLTGVGAIFSAVEEVHGMKISSIFTPKDIPAYQSHKPADCPMCQAGQKLDAIVNSFGYSKL
ncbi:MAG: orotate phosphoribosyltransferase [Oscillospiraceae bacterium]